MDWEGVGVEVDLNRVVVCDLTYLKDSPSRKRKNFSQKFQLRSRFHFLNLFSPMIHHSSATGQNSMIKHEYFGHIHSFIQGPNPP